MTDTKMNCPRTAHSYLLVLAVIFCFSACDSVDEVNRYIPPAGTAEPLQGKVVLASSQSGKPQLFELQPDASQFRQITSAEYGYSQPSWSPDGRTIVAIGHDAIGERGQPLYMIDADGEAIRPLTIGADSPSPLLGTYPDWSPVGSNILFEHCTNCAFGGQEIEIYTFDVQTNDFRQITESPGWDIRPRWSPTGERIAFLSGREYYDAPTDRFRVDLYVMNADGTETKKLTNGGHVSREFCWGPFDSSITFADSRGARNPELYIVDLESGERHVIETQLDSEVALHPIGWSHDKRTVLVALRQLDAGELYIHSLDAASGRVEKLLDEPVARGIDWYKEN